MFTIVSWTKSTPDVSFVSYITLINQGRSSRYDKYDMSFTTFYWPSQEVIIQMITHFATKYPNIHGLYMRQDQDQQSMQQRCPLNERKDKSLASIELI